MVTFTQAHREFIEKYFEDEVLDLPYDAQELLDCEDASQVLEALSDMDAAILRARAASTGPNSWMQSHGNCCGYARSLRNSMG